MRVRFFNGTEVARALPYAALVSALRNGLCAAEEVLPRNVHNAGEGHLVLMPAWTRQAGIVKVATLFPGNPARGLPTIQAEVLLFDGVTGTPAAVVDGTELTLRRTAATSALAASYLARPDAATLLVIGTGALAPHMAEAHAAVRPIRRILVWGRSPKKAEALAERLQESISGADVAIAGDLVRAAAEVDVITCATRSPEPLVLGAWLPPGCHVDLVGNFSPEGRECDEEAVRRARVFVDTLDGALSEAGELLLPLARGTIDRGHIVGELADLCRKAVPGRRAADEITLFKSVGAAIEDLVAAQAVLAWSGDGT
jgi:ornithine cyclodeaminase